MGETGYPLLWVGRYEHFVKIQTVKRKIRKKGKVVFCIYQVGLGLVFLVFCTHLKCSPCVMDANIKGAARIEN